MKSRLNRCILTGPHSKFIACTIGLRLDYDLLSIQTSITQQNWDIITLESLIRFHILLPCPTLDTKPDTDKKTKQLNLTFNFEFGLESYSFVKIEEEEFN